MKNNCLISSRIKFIVVTAVTVILSACVATTDPYHYRAEVIYPDAVPPPVIAYSAPPPLQMEEPGIAPAPGYFWISGVWLWKEGRHVWDPGHWSAQRPGYEWQPHRWHHAGHEWRMDGGHWMRNGKYR